MSFSPGSSNSGHINPEQIKPNLQQPAYTATDHQPGIVHLGLGAFHRAHQAVYTDDALAAAGSDWRIIGVSLRSAAIAKALNAQNGLYTLIVRGIDGSSARQIGSLDHVIAAAENRAELLAVMTQPAIRIVSLTVTEKAYGIQRTTGSIDRAHPDVAADLENPHFPVGVLGILAEALRLRRASGLAPLTVLCCDNLPDNGVLLRAGVIDFAKQLDTDLSDWIASEVAFPSTMVDRITPAATPQTLVDARKLSGVDDCAAMETEPFTQWVIEDNFPQGRPFWEAGARAVC